MHNKLITRHEYGPGGSYLFSNFTQHIEPKDVQIIFEAGSRDLLDAIALKNHYKNSTVYAFECNPEGIEMCRHNLKNETNNDNSEKAALVLKSNEVEELLVVLPLTKSVVFLFDLPTLPSALN